MVAQVDGSGTVPVTVTVSELCRQQHAVGEQPDIERARSGADARDADRPNPNGRSTDRSKEPVKALGNETLQFDGAAPTRPSETVE